MALLRDTDIVSVTEAARRGISALLVAVERGEDIVVARHSTPVAAIVSMERLNALQELEADLRDLCLVMSRMATDSGRRTGLDEVIASLGYTRAELAALPDE